MRRLSLVPALHLLLLCLTQSSLRQVSGIVVDDKRLDDPEAAALPVPLVISRGSDPAVDTKFLQHVRCRGPHLTSCPNFASDCSRAVLDNQFAEEDIRALHSIAAKGMGAREKIGGPTILDINTVRAGVRERVGHAALSKVLGAKSCCSIQCRNIQCG